MIQQLTWPNDVRRELIHGTPASAGRALLNMNVGLRALPVDPATKKPFGWLTPHGVHDATDDPAKLSQLLALAGDESTGERAGLAIVPGQGFSIIDDDDGTLDVSQFGVDGTFSESTRRGAHYWVQSSKNFRLGKLNLPHHLGQLLTGDNSYVLMSPTPGYAPVDVEAPILSLPPDSILLRPTREIVTGSHQITAADESHARRVIDRIRHQSKYAGLLSDDWTSVLNEIPWVRDHSRSGRDFALAVIAKYLLPTTERSTEILAAILMSTSEKARDSGVRYALRTAMAALTESPRDDHALAVALGLIQSGISHRCDYGTMLHVYSRLDRKRWLRVAVQHFAEVLYFDVFTRSDGWRQIPVYRVASLVDVDRKTVSRALQELASEGVIERKTEVEHVGGRVIKSTFVRVINWMSVDD